MTKDEFIKNVLFCFRDYFADDSEKQYWCDNYNLGISNSFIDFEKLYKKFLTEYKSTMKRPPLPSWFNEYYKDCRITNVQENQRSLTCTGTKPPDSFYKAVEQGKKINSLLRENNYDFKSVSQIVSQNIEKIIGA